MSRRSGNPPRWFCGRRASRAALTAVVASAAIATGAAVGGCAADPTQGYSFSHTHDERVRTVAVPIFENETFSHGIEAELTEAIIKEIQRTTPWAVTRSDAAQTTIRGTIRSVDMRRLSPQPTTNLTMEMGVEMRIDFDWTDNRSGEVMLSRRNFTALGTFLPARGTGERLAVGERDTVQRMARAIVAELRGEW